MVKKERSQISLNKEEEIKIDYENIDVSDIMEQIKLRIARKPPSAREKFPRGEPYYEPSAYYPDKTPEDLGTKGKARSLMLKLMRPFSPLIKLLILPVYQEFRETVLILDRTNKRLDYLSSTINEVDKTLHLVAEDLKKTMEYTKLLHTLSHNLVVELSKLKIEEDNLKLKTRIMEKDFEQLGKREKALEKHFIK